MSSQSGTSRAAHAAESEPARHVPQLEPSSILLLSHLQLLDPILQFLTRATGRSLISLSTLRRTLPQGSAAATSIRSIPELGRRGILRLAVRRRPAAAAAVEEANRGGDGNGDEGLCADDMIFDEDEVYQRYDAVLNSATGAQEMTDADNNDGGGQSGVDEEEMLLVGFFPKPGHFNGEYFAAETAAADTSSAKSSPPNNGNGLHGATKTGAKKRLAALRKSLKADEKRQKQAAKGNQGKASTKGATTTKKRRRKEAQVKGVVGDSSEIGKGEDVPTKPLNESQSASVGETDA